MSERTYRVIVRGVFADLDDTQRTELLASAGEHDILKAAFTEDGTLVYDRELRAFSFRCVVRQAADLADEAAGGTACDRAATALAARAIGHGALRTQVTSVDDMKIRRPRQR
ncbi:hypothetical protein Snoj_71790 [Streptomyces nojiriensis]|uniref:Uncharacterized protein n=1 Tax=Streptomyces nojiriensis TaxID=66374 RepID=A0ABQ3SYS1_9ACTN|nr:DUF6204 family protein [Streptomyces nojiriensis]QTI46776.1 hypothetical protein JYK04_04614 [Streptomyces nojiriensis]GGS01275.1 hypothetical protein GCM10010205_32660 [Streptomyces nojiriensis]GHI73261.1 hypothetical protein Snoj_71790 [Streptomyces nojiriensis]